MKKINTYSDLIDVISNSRNNEFINPSTGSNVSNNSKNSKDIRLNNLGNQSDDKNNQKNIKNYTNDQIKTKSNTKRIEISSTEELENILLNTDIKII